MTKPDFTVLIVDDETPARLKLRHYLGHHADVSTIYEASNGRLALQAMREVFPNIVFLDIHMPECDAWQFLEHWNAEDFPKTALIFTTANAEFALRAFENDALDYLLKPFDQARFDRAFAKAKASLMVPIAKPPVLLLQENAKIFRLAIHEIFYAESADNYVEIHCAAKTHLLRMSLTQLEQKLGNIVVRCHRRHLVARDKLAAFHSESHGDGFCELSDGRRVPVSRSYKEQVLSALLK